MQKTDFSTEVHMEDTLQNLFLVIFQSYHYEDYVLSLNPKNHIHKLLQELYRN